MMIRNKLTMSKSYKKNKYQKSRRFDKSCRCHGGCPWCKNNKLYNDIKNRQVADLKIEEYYKGDFMMTLDMFIEYNGVSEETGSHFKKWLGFEGSIKLPEQEWEKLWMEFNDE